MSTSVPGLPSQCVLDQETTGTAAVSVPQSQLWGAAQGLGNLLRPGVWVCWELRMERRSMNKIRTERKD